MQYFILQSRVNKCGPSKHFLQNLSIRLYRSLNLFSESGRKGRAPFGKPLVFIEAGTTYSVTFLKSKEDKHFNFHVNMY